MLTLLILIILFVGAYSGYKNGLIVQLIRTIGYIIVAYFALDYYIPLSEFLYLLIPYPTPFAPASNPYLFYEEQYMFSIELTYYRLISFMLLLFIGWILVRLLSQFINYIVEQFKMPEPFNGIGGAVVGVIVNYVGVFYLLFLTSLIPFNFVQSPLIDSVAANFILTSSPVLTEENHTLFVAEVHDEYEATQPTMEIEPSNEESNEETAEENNEE